jgi:SAM-dependent methyltransferase
MMAEMEQPVKTQANASATHDAMVAAYDAQRARVAPDGDAWAGCAQAFKSNPHRDLDATLAKIASYLRADDVLLDVGGGAGRFSLPLALRCREAIVVDPSPAMGEVFRATAQEAGITNARFVHAGWPADGLEGDVSLVSHVTYFVPAIVPFIEKLHASTRRRVLIDVRSVPPPNQIAELFRFVSGEDLAPVPGHEQLHGVLDEMGIAAELIDVGPALAPATMPPAPTPEDAARAEVEGAVRGGWLKDDRREELHRFIDERFDELFVQTDGGYRRRSAAAARELLITWPTSGAD